MILWAMISVSILLYKIVKFCDFNQIDYSGGTAVSGIKRIQYHIISFLSFGRPQLYDSICYMTREHPLMTSDFRVGRGVQNDPKIGRFRVKKGR